MKTNNPYNINRVDPECEIYARRVLDLCLKYYFKELEDYKQPTREDYIKNGVDPDFMESLAANDHLRIMYFESCNKSITSDD